MVPNPLTMKMIGLIAIQSRDYFPEESQKDEIHVDLFCALISERPALGLKIFFCP